MPRSPTASARLAYTSGKDQQRAPQAGTHALRELPAVPALITKEINSILGIAKAA